jgi:hypothetical protein
LLSSRLFKITRNFDEQTPFFGVFSDNAAITRGGPNRPLVEYLVSIAYGTKLPRQY